MDMEVKWHALNLSYKEKYTDDRLHTQAVLTLH